MARVAVDIGGTFTDVVYHEGGRVLVLKVPTSRDDPSYAVRAALAGLDESGVRPEEIARFAHGTTIATNAMIERTGARPDLITTEGFRDTLVLGREMRRQRAEIGGTAMRVPVRDGRVTR